MPQGRQGLHWQPCPPWTPLPGQATALRIRFQLPRWESLCGAPVLISGIPKCPPSPSPLLLSCCAYAPCADQPVRGSLGRKSCLFIVAFCFLCRLPCDLVTTSRVARWTCSAPGEDFLTTCFHVLSPVLERGAGCTSKRRQSEDQLASCGAKTSKCFHFSGVRPSSQDDIPLALEGY